MAEEASQESRVASQAARAATQRADPEVAAEEEENRRQEVEEEFMDEAEAAEAKEPTMEDPMLDTKARPCRADLKEHAFDVDRQATGLKTVRFQAQSAQEMTHRCRWSCLMPMAPSMCSRK